MTYPRAHLVDPSGGVYHVCSRCVRRAWLCGTDESTGYNFDHRRGWLEDRILELADIFAIDLFGYAVMSNHYHVVLKLDPEKATGWSDEQIVEKWLTLCPKYRSHANATELKAIYKQKLLEDHERLQELRTRLTSLSWLMRFINEPLARLANKEDECTGRFWEGRFKSQQLLDETAVLAAMVYVDLNPVRAGTANDVSEAKHTSLHKRLGQAPNGGKLITSLNQPNERLPFDYTLHDYIELCRWTIETQRHCRPPRPIRRQTPHEELWLQHYLPQPGRWQRASGSFQSLKDYAKELGQCWIKTRSPSFQT